MTSTVFRKWYTSLTYILQLSWHLIGLSAYTRRRSRIRIALLLRLSGKRHRVETPPTSKHNVRLVIKNANFAVLSNNSEMILCLYNCVNHPGRKTAVTTCAFTKDGKLIAGAMIDGSIQLWKSTGPYVCQHTPPHSASPVNYLLPFHFLLPLYLDLSLQTWCHLFVHPQKLSCSPAFLVLGVCINIEEGCIKQGRVPYLCCRRCAIKPSPCFVSMCVHCQYKPGNRKMGEAWAWFWQTRWWWYHLQWRFQSCQVTWAGDTGSRAAMSQLNFLKQ